MKFVPATLLALTLAVVSCGAFAQSEDGQTDTPATPSATNGPLAPFGDILPPTDASTLAPPPAGAPAQPGDSGSLAPGGDDEPDPETH
jgi:hypothetical protein